jgi:uncharacterized protein YydD (DUF2326 family)
MSDARQPYVNEELMRALREMGEPATPEELRASGVTMVRRVRKEMLSRLIEKAVNRTLMARTMGVSEEELRELVAGAQKEFRRMLKTEDEIEAIRAQVGEQRAGLKEQLKQIREEIADRRGFEEQRAAEEASREPTEIELAEEERLADEIRIAFEGQLEDVSPQLRHVQRIATERALGVLRAARHTAFEAGLAKSRDDVQQLERRVAKLVATLDSTETVLKRVAAMKDIEFGLASIYRDVQGLAPDESDSERKRDLMTQLFQKNLELYMATRGAAPEAPATA